MEKFWIILAILLVIAVVAIVGLRIFKKKQMEKFFTQLSMESQMVPKQKRRSFILLMFKESMVNAKKAKKDPNAVFAKMQNPKYLDMQLMQMSVLLKNPDKATDKNTKKALMLFSQFEAWEKKKAS